MTVWHPGSCWRCQRCPDGSVPPPALGSSKGLSESGSLAKVAAVMEVIQSSSSAVQQCLAAFRHILEMLEEEPKLEQQAGTAQGGLGIGSAR